MATVVVRCSQCPCCNCGHKVQMLLLLFACDHRLRLRCLVDPVSSNAHDAGVSLIVFLLLPVFLFRLTVASKQSWYKVIW